MRVSAEHVLSAQLSAQFASKDTARCYGLDFLLSRIALEACSSNLTFLFSCFLLLSTGHVEQYCPSMLPSICPTTQSPIHRSQTLLTAQFAPVLPSQSESQNSQPSLPAQLANAQRRKCRRTTWLVVHDRPALARKSRPSSAGIRPFLGPGHGKWPTLMSCQVSSCMLHVPISPITGAVPTNF